MTGHEHDERNGQTEEGIPALLRARNLRGKSVTISGYEADLDGRTARVPDDAEVEKSIDGWLWTVEVILDEDHEPDERLDIPARYIKVEE